ncbi:hypothetical protein [Thermanaeromonas toyohensis]|uniref:hypothetical protein n=1 Tax=Thermanaeromonas toyohensis TaxID=161154 RepID=UPI003BF49825
MREHGPASLAHGNRVRKPAHTIPEVIRQQVVPLAQTKYWGWVSTSQLLSLCNSFFHLLETAKAPLQ